MCTDIVAKCLNRITRTEKLKFIEKNSFLLCGPKAKFPQPSLRAEEYLAKTAILCNYTDRYHKGNMGNELTKELNTLLRLAA
jgi:hypothetical protein